MTPALDFSRRNTVLLQVRPQRQSQRNGNAEFAALRTISHKCFTPVINII